jgi:transglycosylase-like protein with SLT domain
MANKEVIRAFLVSLGYQVDAPSTKQFLGILAATDGRAKLLGKTLVGVAAAAEAMVLVFAHNMEKLYYISKRTGASVENIQGLEYAFEQIGLKGDDAIQTLEGMSRALRSNPGLTALLNALGVKTEGRDRVAVMIDFVKQLKTMPFYIAQQFAQMFGIDPDTLLMLEQGQDKLNEALATRIRLNKLAGIDGDQAAAASKEYANALRELWTRVEVLGSALSIKLLPYFRQLTGVMNEFLDDAARADFSSFDELAISLHDIGANLSSLNKTVKEFRESNGFITVFDTVLNKIKDVVKALGKVGSIWSMLFDGALTSKEGTARLWAAIVDANQTLWGNNDPTAKLGLVPGQPAPGPAQPHGGGVMGKIKGAIANNGGAAVMGKIKGAIANNGGAAVLFKGLESAYGLPPGILDAVWAQESNRGQKMLSPRGAQGHFQFIPATAKQYGVTDPNDLTNSATGAAKYLAYLQKLFKGDLADTLRGYNAGEGNLMEIKAGHQAMREETRNYAPQVMARMGATINQETKISVTGVKDPEAAAAAIVAAQRQVNADMARNAASVPQ